MNVLVVEPGYAPYEKQISDYKEINSIVGATTDFSLIERGEAAIICQEDGEELGLQFNRHISELINPIYGPFVICGYSVKDRAFTSLSPIQLSSYKKKYHMAEIPVRKEGAEFAVMRVSPKNKNLSPKRPKPPER